MSLRAIPLIVISFILYNVLVLMAGGASNEMATFLQKEQFAIPLMTGARLSIAWGDVLVLLTLVLLFVEIMKSTHGSTSSLVDHALSMVVFVFCLIELLMVKAAGTAVFFTITVATMIDVIAGYTIAISVARKSVSLGSDNN